MRGHWVLLGGLAGTIAAVAARDGAGGTASTFGDVVWIALFGALLGALSSAAGPAAWLVVAGLLAPCAWGDLPATALVVVVLATAYAVIARPALLDGGSVLVGATLPVTMLRLVWPSGTGATAAVAALVTGIVVVAALRRLPTTARRRVLVAGGVVAAAAFVVTCAALLSLVAERTRLERASSAVQAGLDATRAGDAPQAADLLAGAAADFAGAAERLDRPWAAAGRGVPLLGPQMGALDALVDAAADLSAAGARAAGAIDPDRLRPTNGRVDLSLLDAMVDPVVEARDALADARRRIDGRRSPWLLGALDRTMSEMTTRADDAAADARAALRAIEIVPALLGDDGERRWLLVIQTPSELRGAGGFPGSFGVIRTANGRIELERLGRISELSQPMFEQGVAAVGPAEYLERYRALFDLDRWFQNSTASPHFPSAAEAMTGRYTALTGQRVDGAIVLDPTAFAALLGLVGPVQLAGWPVPIDAGNARQVLLYEQYLLADTASDQRVDLLSSAARAVFDRVVGGALPGPADVGTRLSPLLPARNIQLWSAHPDEQSWFSSIGATGAMAPVRGDALAVVVNDGSNAKIDWFLERDITYDVDVAADGTTTAELVIRLTNDAPTSGLPSYLIGPAYGVDVAPGTNRMLLSVFTPLDVTDAADVTVDGRPTRLRKPTREQDRNTVEVFLDVLSGATVEVRMQLAGELPAGAYRLDVHAQPVVNADELHVTVNGESLFDGPQATDLVLRRD